jgi:hypothetical protein
MVIDPASPDTRSAPLAAGSSRVGAHGALLALVVAYLVALLAVPTDLGVRLVVVWTPARIILIAGLVLAIVSRQLGISAQRRESRAILVGWALFLGAAGVSTALVPSTASVARFMSMCLEGVGLYFLVRAVAITPSAVRTLVVTLIAATAAVGLATLLGSALGIRYDSAVSALFGAPVGERLAESRFGFIRHEGSFPAPLFFAVWLASCALLPLAWAIDRSIRERLVAAGVWVSLFIEILVLTVSRIAFTGVLVLSGLYLLAWRRWAAGAILVVAGLVTGLGLAGVSIGAGGAENIVTVVPGGVPEPGASPPTEADVLAGSSAYRIEALKASFAAVVERPFLGWGLLSAKEVVSRIAGAPNYVDSTYLVMAVELGLVGVAAFVVLAIAIARAGIGAIHTPVGSAIAFSLLSVLAMSVLAAFLVITQGYALTAVLAALYVAIGRGSSLRTGPSSAGIS